MPGRVYVYDFITMSDDKKSRWQCIGRGSCLRMEICQCLRTVCEQR